MSSLETYESRRDDSLNNMSVYEKEINAVVASIEEIVTALKSDDLKKVSDMVNRKATVLKDYEKDLKGVMSLAYSDDYIDYSVTKGDLEEDREITVNGKTYVIMRNKSTGAQYIIMSEGYSNNQNKAVISAMKDYLAPGEMAIVTYNNEYFFYDPDQKSKCTEKYSVVGKTEQSKMYAFLPTSSSSLVVDHDSNNPAGDDCPMVAVNGLILCRKMQIVMETGTELNMTIQPLTRLGGGNNIQYFMRLCVSNGVKESAGNQYADLKLVGEWEKYNDSKSECYVNNRCNNNIVWLEGVDQSKDNMYSAHYNHKNVGTVPDTRIPFTITAKDTPGVQSMQATIQYICKRKTQYNNQPMEGKDMTYYEEKIVSTWNL